VPHIEGVSRRGEKSGEKKRKKGEKPPGCPPRGGPPPSEKGGKSPPTPLPGKPLGFKGPFLEKEPKSMALYRGNPPGAKASKGWTQSPIRVEN